MDDLQEIKEKRLQKIKGEYEYTAVVEDKPLIAGFRFLKRDYSLLESWIMRSDMVQYSGEPWVHRRIVLEKKEDILWIDIFVAQERSTDVYDALFESYLDYEYDYARVPAVEYELGDTCFVDEEHLSADFVRNNVAVKLAAAGTVDINLVELAKLMDEMLKANPTFLTLEESGKKPIIKAFSCEEYVKRDGKAPLQIDAVDPDKEELTFTFETTSGSVNKESKMPGYYYRAGNECGTQTITLHVINEKNVVTTSHITIMVK